MKAVYMVAAVLVALPAGAGQVKTNVPDPVPGARPATVERITIHGPSLEGNLEGDAVDRAAIVFAAGLPPEPDTSLSGRLRATRILDWRGPVVAGDPRAADDRGRLCQRRAR
jgi:hypothetical protein